MAGINIRPNARVMTSDGELGRVRHVVLDRDTRTVTRLVVGRDGQEWLIPAEDVASSEGDRVVLRGSIDQYQSAEPFDRNRYRSADASGAGRPEAGTTQPDVPATVQADEHPYRVQLLEERLKVDKHREQVGEVKVGKRVTEHVETVDVPVQEERVVIERVPAAGQVSADDSELEEAVIIEVPVMKEHIQVTKAPVVAEEVTVRKEAVEHAEQIQETVRKEELVVDDARGLVHGDTGPGTSGDGHRAPAEEHPPGTTPRP